MELGRLLTQASTVDIALHVHKSWPAFAPKPTAWEGRRQLLEKDTDFAKVSVTLSPHRPLVRASFSEFGVSLRRAGADSISLGAAVALGGIRLLGVVVPFLLLFGAPGWALFRLLRRRQARSRAELIA